MDMQKLNLGKETLFQEKLQLPDLPSVTPDFEIR